MTDRCKNITLATTSLRPVITAIGREEFPLSVSYKDEDGDEDEFRFSEHKFLLIFADVQQEQYFEFLKSPQSDITFA